VLRRLAARQAALALDPVNCERRDAWLRHDAGAGSRPLVLTEFCGVRDADPPLPDSVLECEDRWARNIERGLRSTLYRFDGLRDDHVVEPWMHVRWQVDISDRGVAPVVHYSDADVTLGARRWDPPLKNLDADFAKLHPRTATVDREATYAEKERLESVLGDILPVRIRGGFWWTLGLTWSAIDLIGLENLMLFMYDDPEGLHRLMGFLRDDARAFAAWCEAEGLLSLNNENDGMGSGSMGYTRDLPQSDADPVLRRDLWALIESQETVGVGPELFEAFIFPYQLDLAGDFGKVYYGCCEPVHSRWRILRRIPGLSRVSVSPWCDEEFMAAEIGDCVYSRKPNPALVSTGVFDETRIRADIRHTLDVAAGHRIEIIMKDVHTLHNEPDRLARWVAIAREECGS
ncbi:hypothetical protein HQ560_22620, partial [bacterium]|nr:hypothetical protein [bacterium]